MKKQQHEQEIIILQNKFHTFLSSFYTVAGSSAMNKILYPYFYTCCSNDDNILNSYNEFEEKACSYFQNAKKGKKRNELNMCVRSINIDNYPINDTEYISVLNNLQKIGERLREEKKGILILFGSLATVDYVKGHSDLDTALIISKEACLNPQMLISLRKDVAEIMKESFFIDQLQHHGPYIFTELDCKMFPQHYLPFAVFKNAVSLCGDTKLCFFERNRHDDEIKEELEKYKKMFLGILRMPKLPKSIYRTKCLFQSILLFPSIYLLAKKKPCYKRESFVEIKKYLNYKRNSKACELLDRLSSIRLNNMFRTQPASVAVQNVFRAVPHPFVYPSLWRLFFFHTLDGKERKEIEALLPEAVEECIECIDVELKKYGNK